MKIKFLGSGGAFVNDKENYHSNILIIGNKEILLYDAGCDIRNSLNYSNYAINDIDKIFISHLHSDHCGGIEFLGFSTLFSKQQKITLISSKNILKNGWKHHWSGTMKYTHIGKLFLKDYFDILTLKNSFLFENIKIKVIKNNHITTNKYKLPSFGLKFKNKKKVFISGDTTLNKTRLNKLKNYDLIFHECNFAGNNNVHTTLNELKTLNKNIISKIWIYHYDLKGKDFYKMNHKIQKLGFKGLVKRGDEFKF